MNRDDHLEEMTDRTVRHLMRREVFNREFCAFIEGNLRRIAECRALLARVDKQLKRPDQLI